MNKKYFEQRLSELDTNYNQYKPHWQELADFFLPRQARFLVNDANKTPTTSKKIKDSRPRLAIRKFYSGLMTGATNPAQKWLKLSIQNFGKEASYQVKSWCSSVSTLCRDVFNASNLYQNLPVIYMNLGVFGIAVLSIERDFDSIINTRCVPIGSYRIARNKKGKVDTLYRVYSETAKNLYDEFGEENVSDFVRECVQNGRYETSVEVVHAVESNLEFMQNSPWAKNKKYISVYYERNGNKNETKLLNKSGFDYFPYVVFEAEITGEDTYPCDCPGMIALADVKQLMVMVTEDGKAVKKIVTPPKTGPANIDTKKMSDNPGSFTPGSSNSAMKLEPVYQVNPAILTPLENRMENIQNVIKEAFYNDLFAMILNTSGTSRTATEIDELKAEKMVLLSPLLEQVHTSLKDIIEILFFILADLKILPPPPEEIQGQEIKVEFISILAQAMKASNIASIERFTTFTSNIAATIDPSATMKVDVNNIIDDYADLANIEPDQVVPTEVVEQKKAEMAKQQQQQQMMANMQQGSEIIKNMGGSDASGGNLMERIGLQ